MSGRTLARYLTLCCVVVFSFHLGCKKKQSNEIPITTNSEEALKFFIQGRDLSENILNDDAAVQFKKALDADPDFAMANLYYAQTGRKLTSQQILNYFKKAVEASANISEGERLYILSSDASRKSNWPEYKKLCEQLVELFPDDKRAQMALGYYYVVQEDYKTAIQYMEKAIDIDENYSLPYNMMGYFYSNSGEYAKAEKALQKYIELVPKLANPHDTLGEVFMKQGRLVEAIGEFRRALSINPRFYDSYLGMANALALLNSYDEARAKLNELYDVAPDYVRRATALFGMAITYCYEGRWNEALGELYKQFEIESQNDDQYSMYQTLLNIAQVLTETGNIKSAAKRLNLARQLITRTKTLAQEIKENAVINMVFAEVELELKKNDIKAAQTKTETYKRYMETGKNPNSVQGYHSLLGRIALQQRLYDVAISEMELASKQNAENFYLLGLAYAGKGETAKAQENLTKAVNFNALASLDFALVRNPALKKLQELTLQFPP